MSAQETFFLEDQGSAPVWIAGLSSDPHNKSDSITFVTICSPRTHKRARTHTHTHTHTHTNISILS